MKVTIEVNVEGTSLSDMLVRIAGILGPFGSAVPTLSGSGSTSSAPALGPLGHNLPGGGPLPGGLSSQAVQPPPAARVGTIGSPGLAVTGEQPSGVPVIPSSQLLAEGAPTPLGEER